MEAEKPPAAFGRNSSHYERHFERMQRAQKTWVPGWNWAALVHSTGWFWYRRMYGWSVLNLIAPVGLLLLLVFVVQWFVPGNDLQVPMAVAGIGYLLLVFVLLPLYADSFYLYRLRKDGAVPKAPSALTAVGALLIIVIPALMTYVVVDAQREYDQRARVREGVIGASSLKAPVAGFYREQRRLPGEQEAARFRFTEPMKYTASVGWDPARRAIVVTMAERFGGKRFEMAPAEKDGAIEWTCRTIDLDPAQLPPSCR